MRSLRPTFESLDNCRGSPGYRSRHLRSKASHDGLRFKGGGGSSFSTIGRTRRRGADGTNLPAMLLDPCQKIPATPLCPRFNFSQPSFTLEEPGCRVFPPPLWAWFRSRSLISRRQRTLTRLRRPFFRDVVASSDPRHFRHEDRELLALYACHTVAARKLMKRKRLRVSTPNTSSIAFTASTRMIGSSEFKRRM